MFDLPDQFYRDREEIDDLQREIVAKIRERMKADDLSNADLCKFADQCSDFQKLANDREKTAISRERVMVSERRTSAHYHIARGRNETQLELARLRAETAKARSRPDHPQVDEDDPTAPWGRKKDGEPYTQDEFRDSLNEAIRDIWGLPPISPENKMPDGWNRDEAMSAADAGDFSPRPASSRHSPDPPPREASPSLDAIASDTG